MFKLGPAPPYWLLRRDVYDTNIDLISFIYIHQVFYLFAWLQNVGNRFSTSKLLLLFQTQIIFNVETYNFIAKMIPIHRYHAPQHDGKRYYFTTSTEISNGWIYDGIAFYVPDNNDPKAVPCYEFHHDQSQTYGGWRYAFSKSMAPSNENWTYDKVAFNVYPHQLPGTIPIYEFHHRQTDGWRLHLSYLPKLATDEWTLVGIAFFAFSGLVE